MMLNRDTLAMHVGRNVALDLRMLKITHEPTNIMVEGISGPTEKIKTLADLEKALLLTLTDKVMEHYIVEWSESESEDTVYEHIGISWEQYAAWVDSRDERQSFDTIGTELHEDPA